MKRCPQCEFIYPDSDAVCDFDQTSLVLVAESEVAAITNTPARPALSDLAATHTKNFEKRKSRKALPIAVGLGLVLGIVVFSVYFAVHRQMVPPPIQQSSNVTPQPVAQMPSPSPSPSTSPSVTESPLPEEGTDKASKSTPPSSKTSTSHTTTSLGPVSTSETVAKNTGQKVILLTSGGKVEADEVWKTKDGVWYRRDGLVTLLKKNRVKAIVGQ